MIITQVVISELSQQDQKQIKIKLKFIHSEKATKFGGASANGGHNLPTPGWNRVN